MASDTKEKVIANLDELEDFAKSLLDKGRKKFALSGDLGAGKTAFVKICGKLLGIEKVIQSPTFALLSEYSLANERFYHFDLYRLTNSEEIFDLGFEEYWEEDAFVFIEWPELVADELPGNFLHLKFEYMDKDRRKVQILNDRMME